MYCRPLSGVHCYISQTPVSLLSVCRRGGEQDKEEESFVGGGLKSGGDALL